MADIANSPTKSPSNLSLPPLKLDVAVADKLLEAGAISQNAAAELKRMIPAINMNSGDDSKLWGGNQPIAGVHPGVGLTQELMNYIALGQVAEKQGIPAALATPRPIVVTGEYNEVTRQWVAALQDNMGLPGGNGPLPSGEFLAGLVAAADDVRSRGLVFHIQGNYGAGHNVSSQDKPAGRLTPSEGYERLLVTETLSSQSLQAVDAIRARREQGMDIVQAFYDNPQGVASGKMASPTIAAVQELLNIVGPRVYKEKGLSFESFKPLRTDGVMDAPTQQVVNMMYMEYGLRDGVGNLPDNRLLGELLAHAGGYARDIGQARDIQSAAQTGKKIFQQVVP
ncbi:MAG: hypothetical protein PHC51_00355 [bacterium]|nr:hypothetical protein [bacterium]